MKIKLGVDGGGTKTEVIAINPKGEILAHHLAEGCNPSVVGNEAAEKILRNALADTLAEAHRAVGARQETLPEAALLCMAGNREFWRSLAERLEADGIDRVEATDDAAPVLELATLGRPGLVLHAGTGSFVAARDADGKPQFAGGLGWRLGDEGSAYDLGKRAAARTLLELQGWESSSRLGSAVQKALHEAEAGALSKRIYDSPTSNADLAALAPLVTQLADVNEAIALEILTASLGALAAQASRVHEKLFGRGATVPCGLSGPVLRGAAAQRILRNGLPSCLNALVITDAPIEGVRRLLLRHG